MMEKTLVFLRTKLTYTQGTRKKVKTIKREPLVESQIFIMELARELNKLFKKSDVLVHIWSCEDVWPPQLCREFIMDWAAVIEDKEKTLLIDYTPEKQDWRGHLLGMLEQGGEHDMGPYKRFIMDWVRQQKARHQNGIWPGEGLLMILDDLEFQWKRGRLPSLQSTMELLILAALEENHNKDAIHKMWLVQKQRNQKIEHGRCVAEEVNIDRETANPYLVISEDNKKMRCGFEKREVPNSRQRFDSWWCALGSEGFAAGRHYWEVEVGDRDWRLGVATESALRSGYRPLSMQAGYLTLRLERGAELKALTVPCTHLTQSPAPRKVGVYLDYDEGQLSFYDAERRAHIYTYAESFTEKLYPVFGTVEVVRDMAIRPAGLRERCFCRGPCLWS
uniref:B30.2/SPRY domain-containing protein n=1 Tax=Denticeps clupeoides TaxID=299321 RepID=A0AAY4CKX5_9TELE